MNDKVLLNGSVDSEVTARPGGQLWVVFGVLALTSAVLGAGAVCPYGCTPNPAQEPLLSPRLLIGALSLLSGAGALFLLATIFSSRVVASSSGVRWRRLFRGEISASWDQVTDYYARFSKYNIPELQIKTLAGTISVPQHWQGLDALKAIVERCATHAQARTWETLGTRMRDMPQTFDYSLRWFVTSYPPFLLVPVVGILMIATTLTEPRSPIVPAGFGLWIAAITLLPLTLLLGIPVWLDLRRRKQQRLVADSDGLEYSDGTRRVSAKWQEVIRLRSCFSKLMPTFVVETTHGDFDFSILIRNLLPLLTLLRSVTRSGTLPVELAGEGPDSSPESAARLEFRLGSMIRSMKLMPIGFLFCAAFGFALGCLRDRTFWPQEAPPMMKAALICLAGWALMEVWFSRARITVRDDGLRKRGLLRERFIPWDDVREFYLTGPAGAPVRAIVVGANGSIRFVLQITDRNILLEEIARRAKASKTQHWEHRVTPF